MILHICKSVFYFRITPFTLTVLKYMYSATTNQKCSNLYSILLPLSCIWPQILINITFNASAWKVSSGTSNPTPSLQEKCLQTPHSWHQRPLLSSSLLSFKHSLPPFTTNLSFSFSVCKQNHSKAAAFYLKTVTTLNTGYSQRKLQLAVFVWIITI